ncbi:helix-turn-helix transcriptional regulator [Paraburkholderia youngii]|uniref:helix-turn-helix transcriptional regulator n=1 Tax=Paraburkholderia youngii TaxID=2782701 RepID=UPI003D22729D
MDSLCLPAGAGQVSADVLPNLDNRSVTNQSNLRGPAVSGSTTSNDNSSSVSTFDDSSSSQSDRRADEHVEPSVLPGRIANALVIVYEGLKEFGLFENHRRILACLIRFGVDQRNPSKNIYIKKSTIAKHLDINEATVYRGLSVLERAGIIERDDQGRVGRALKVIGHIRLTAFALKRLSLDARYPGQSAAQMARGSDAQARETDLAPVQDVNNKPKQSSLKNHPGAGSFCKIDGKTVPADLAWLHTKNGLRLSGLFALMAAAKKVGSRLSDVVAHCGNSLAALRDRELFAYVKSLLTLPIDYQAVTRAKQAEREVADEKLRQKAEFESRLLQLRALRGKAFVDRDGRLWTVEDTSFLVSDGKKVGSVPFDLARTSVAAITSSDWPECSGHETARTTGTRKSADGIMARSALGALRDQLRRRMAT